MLAQGIFSGGRMVVNATDLGGWSFITNRDAKHQLFGFINASAGNIDRINHLAIGCRLSEVVTEKRKAAGRSEG